MFKYSRPETCDTLAQRYEDQARIQRALISDLRRSRNLLEKLREVFGLLFADEGFTTLLRAEGLNRAPALLITALERPSEKTPCTSTNYVSEADRLLASKKLSPTARYELSRMVPARQEEAARLMIASGCFISPYIRALVGACDKSRLANPKSRARRLVIQQPKRDEANKEITELAAQLKNLSGFDNADLITLFVSVRYAQRLNENARVRRYLRKHWAQAEKDLNEAAKSYSDGPLL